MKKKLIITVLFILMYMIFVSCNSCTSSSAQPPIDTLKFEQQDIIKKDDSLNTIQQNLTAINYTNLDIQNDTQKKVVIKKEIQQMQVDSMQKVRRDSIYRQLEKTQKELKIQQRTIDSMIVIKKK